MLDEMGTMGFQNGAILERPASSKVCNDVHAGELKGINPDESFFLVRSAAKVDPHQLIPD